MQALLRSLTASLLFSVLIASIAMADAQQGLVLATLVAERPANEGRVATMHFHLQSKSGRVRERTALMVHSEVGATERIAIFFTEPSMIEETAFLSFNHADQDDQNWLFLPATDRVRRLPSSDRGDYFMGTDLTFGDVNDNFKFGLSDWDFAAAGEASHDDRVYPVLTGSAKTPALAAEMDYSGFRALVDPDSGFPVLIEYLDRDGEPLKRIQVEDIQPIGGAPTAMRFAVENLQSGHSTRVHFTDMRYAPDLDPELFDPAALAYGIPEID